MPGKDEPLIIASPRKKTKPGILAAADSVLSKQMELMSHGDSAVTVNRTPLHKKYLSLKTAPIGATKKYIAKANQKLSQTRKKAAQAEAEANEYKEAFKTEQTTRRRLREERDALKTTVAHNEEELARIKELLKAHELKTAQDIAVLEEVLARKQLEEKALRTRLDETVLQANDTIARLREALATRPIPAPVPARSPAPVTPPPAFPATKAPSPVPAPVFAKPSFAQVLADVAASKTTPHADLLRDFIIQRNAPVNLYPQEYSGAGAEIEGLYVVQAGIGSSLQKGDRLLSATVKDITVPDKLTKYVTSGKIDFQKIPDPALLSEAMALFIRGLPGSKLTVQIERENKIIDQEITRQLFGTDKEGKLVAFRDPKQIEPSAEMQQLLENIHEEVNGLPKSLVSTASLLSRPMPLRKSTMPLRHD